MNMEMRNMTNFSHVTARCNVGVISGQGSEIEATCIKRSGWREVQGLDREGGGLEAENEGWPAS